MSTRPKGAPARTCLLRDARGEDLGRKWYDGKRSFLLHAHVFLLTYLATSLAHRPRSLHTRYEMSFIHHEGTRTAAHPRCKQSSRTRVCVLGVGGKRLVFDHEL